MGTQVSRLGPRIDTALKNLDGVSKGAPTHTANEMIGFAEPGKGPELIRGQGLWWDGDVFMIGNKSVKSFRAMSPSARVKYLSDPEVFPVDVSKRVETNIGDMVPIDEFNRLLAKSQPGVKALRAEYANPDGTIKNPSKWKGYVVKVLGVVGLKAAIAFTTLSLLAQGRSGCFIVSPGGEEDKVDQGDCSCEGGINNPNALTCCEKCGNKTCPGDKGERGEEWVCPEPSEDTPTSKDGDKCTLCGCDDAWRLCKREVDVFDVLNDIGAGAGRFIDEAGEFVEDLAATTTKVTKTVFIIILVMAGVGVTVAAGVGVSRLVKKRKSAK